MHPDDEGNVAVQLSNCVTAPVLFRAGCVSLCAASLLREGRRSGLLQAERNIPVPAAVIHSCIA